MSAYIGEGFLYNYGLSSIYYLLLILIITYELLNKYVL